MPSGQFGAGDPYRIRTDVNGVRGRCLNHLTNGPIVGINCALLAPGFAESSHRSVIPPLRLRPAPLGSEPVGDGGFG